jgi:hypothetical protein
MGMEANNEFSPGRSQSGVQSGWGGSGEIPDDDCSRHFSNRRSAIGEFPSATITSRPPATCWFKIDRTQSSIEAASSRAGTMTETSGGTLSPTT